MKWLVFLVVVGCVLISYFPRLAPVLVVGAILGTFCSSWLWEINWKMKWNVSVWIWKMMEALKKRQLARDAPLMEAVEAGSVETVRKLLAAGANPKATDRQGWTALMLAAEKGHTATAQALIEKGADVNAAHECDESEVMAAQMAIAWKAAAMKAYPKEGAEVNALRKAGWTGTALMLAAKNGHTETAQELLAAGADANATNESGMTALMYAAENGHTETARAFLAAGAEVNAAENDGWTALMLAARDGHTETARELVAAGADANATNMHGWTALMYAARNGHTDTARAIEEAARQRAAKSEPGRG